MCCATGSSRSSLGSRNSMKRLFSRRASNLLAAAVSVAGLTACASLPDLPRPSRELTFDDSGLLISYKNGLRLFHVQDTSTNLAQVDVRYDVGSRDDPEGQAGMAHLVEHLMFEVTPPAAEGQTLKQALADASLYHNAYTNWDETHYVATGLASEATRMLELEAARLSAVCDDLSEETFLREREVVRNEIRQRIGSRRDALYRQLLAAIYPEGHAYREYIGGDDVQLAAISRDDACQFFQRHYVPANATVVVTGDVDGASVRAVADRVLGPLAREPELPRPEVAATTLSRRRVEFTADVDRPRVAIAFMVPPRFHEDAFAVEIFCELIDSMLHRIVREDGFIADADSVKIGGKRAPAFVVSATVRDEADLKKAEKSLWHAVDASLQAVADGAHMNENARQVKRADVLRRVERLDTRGVALADYFEAPRGYGFYQGDLLGLRRLDGTRVYEVSRRTFARERALTMVARPAANDEAEQVRAGVRFDVNSHSPDERASGLTLADASRPIEYKPGKARAEGVQRYRLENGLQVVLAPRTAMPLVDIRLVFDVGDVDSPDDQPALASLVADAIEPDTAGEEYNLVRGFFLAGGQLFVSVQNETTTFRARGLAIYQDYLLGGL
ncbi:MAG: insulinase family protein, partial [Myxococcales bacterium]|nr:insulinase family protein [Myxococcales bacterium]